jgi:hypothetical protein
VVQVGIDGVFHIAADRAQAGDALVLVLQPVVFSAVEDAERHVFQIENISRFSSTGDRGDGVSKTGAISLAAISLGAVPMGTAGVASTHVRQTSVVKNSEMQISN